MKKSTFFCLFLNFESLASYSRTSLNVRLKVKDLLLRISYEDTT